MQKNASLLAIVAVYTAKNEPSKVCGSRPSYGYTHRCFAVAVAAEAEDAWAPCARAGRHA